MRAIELGFVVLMLMAMPQPSEAQYLTGADRTGFIAGVLNSCNSNKRTPDMRDVPAWVVDDSCKCYANSLADKLTAEQLRTGDPAVTDPIVKSSMRACYEAVKADFIKQHGK